LILKLLKAKINPLILTGHTNEAESIGIHNAYLMANEYVIEITYRVRYFVAILVMQRVAQN
jgi:hypothetical protein